MSEPIQAAAGGHARIVLSTLNATYAHASLGLRYVQASLGPLESQTRIVEFTINEAPRDIAERIVALAPEVLGLGVYIWNVRQTEAVLSIVRRLLPRTLIVLGGPEVSHEPSDESGLPRQRIAALADCILAGEAEALFFDVCRRFLDEGARPVGFFLRGPLPNLATLPLPYRLYGDEDIAHRVIYVEASRGCPYRCEFCLSALDEAVRDFPAEALFSSLEALIARGARQFKFVDRTFNLSVQTSTRILGFFLRKLGEGVGLFLHFELVPDRLPEALRETIARFPPGTMQFEIGVQTFAPEVARRISRPQKNDRIAENLRWLRAHTAVHIHADLIAGLPGETLESFGRGFDALFALSPHEIQVGLLKRLRGAPIARHDAAFGMLYDEEPPYTVVATGSLSFAEVQGIARFAGFWDHYGNRGNFAATMGLLVELGAARTPPSLFAELWQMTAFLAGRHRQVHSIALARLAESAFVYLTVVRGVDPERARQALASDYLRPSGREVPAFLEGLRPPRRNTGVRPPDASAGSTPERQRRHAEAREGSNEDVPAVNR